MPDRMQLAEMNVAICNALGIDPKGIVGLIVIVDKDQYPRIEVTYSPGFIAELVESMDDGTKISERWCYTLTELTEPELAVPAQGSDWVDRPPVTRDHPLPNELPPTTPRPDPSGDGHGY